MKNKGCVREKAFIVVAVLVLLALFINLGIDAYLTSSSTVMATELIILTILLAIGVFTVLWMVSYKNIQMAHADNLRIYTVNNKAKVYKSFLT